MGHNRWVSYQTVISLRTQRKMKNGWCWWGGRPWPPYWLAGGDARPTARRPAPTSYFHINERSKDLGCHSEPSEESLFIKPPRFFTPRRSVQNDMNIYSFLTATSYEFRYARPIVMGAWRQGGRSLVNGGKVPLTASPPMAGWSG